MVQNARSGAEKRLGALKALAVLPRSQTTVPALSLGNNYMAWPSLMVHAGAQHCGQRHG